MGCWVTSQCLWSPFSYQLRQSLSWRNFKVCGSLIYYQCQEFSKWCYAWYWAGPCGAPGQKAFLCSHFFDYRRQTSFSLHDLSWVSRGRFKQLLIREGRGCKTREKQSRAPLGLGPVSPSTDTHNNTFELFYRHWNPSRWEKLTINDGMLPTSM